MTADPSTTTTIEKPAKRQYNRQKLPKMSANHIALNALVDSGVSISEACRSLGVSRTTAHRAKQVRNVYEQQKDSLLRSSVKAVQKLVKGEPFGTIDKVKDSTALAAAGMILDREVPKVNLTQNFSMTVNIDPIDISAFCSLPEVIDISSK
jgi:hypothetical protein